MCSVGSPDRARIVGLEPSCVVASYWTTVMCRELSLLGQSMAAWAAQFDAAALTPGQAGEIVRLCARMEASAASIKALAAARAAEGSDWVGDGYRSAAEHLAHEAGMSPAAAKRALQTGRRLADQPVVAAAALAGDLSAEQAAAVCDGVAANPGKATELVDRARHISMPELNEEIAKVKAAATDPESQRRDRHARRSLRRWTDRDGTLQVHLSGHPEDGVTVWRVLDPIRRRLNVLRREAGAEGQSLDALDYDALVTLAAVTSGQEGELSMSDLVDLGLFPQLPIGPGGVASPAAPSPASPAPPGLPLPLPLPLPSPDSSGSPVASGATKARRAKRLAGSPIRVMIRVDLDTLLRGVPLEGELCEIAGYGPVPVSVIENLLATQNPFVVGLLTKAEQADRRVPPRTSPERAPEVGSRLPVPDLRC